MAGQDRRKLSGGPSCSWPAPGQARRLDVALGIVGRPELLFLDEPTTGFDPEARRQFWELIAELRQDGVTIVLTIRYLDEAEALADRIAVIAAGRIVAEGEPGSLGGRATAAARVSWEPEAGRRSVATATPAQLVAELGREFGGEIPGLTVTRPTLEDTYLELISEAGHAPEHLAVLVLLFAAAQSQNPNAWFLSFAICPMCFHLTTVRRGMVFVVVFNLIAGGLLVWRDPRLAGSLTAVGIVVFAVAFSRVYTTWMIRVIGQSLERAALIEQLESTRAELAAAHHEAGILSERQRLAGEIHDTLAQGFTSIVTLIQAAEAGLGAEESGPRRHLDLALLAARENLAEARTLVTVLSPAALGSGNLGDAPRRTCLRTRR